MKTNELNQEQMRETNGGLSIRQAPPQDPVDQTYFPTDDPANSNVYPSASEDSQATGMSYTSGDQFSAR